MDKRTPGQVAYEADLAAEPLYNDRTRRKTWNELGELERWSWERNPTARAQTARNDLRGERQMQVIKQFADCAVLQLEPGNYMVLSSNNIVLKHTTSIARAYRYAEWFQGVRRARSVQSDAKEARQCRQSVHEIQPKPGGRHHD